MAELTKQEVYNSLGIGPDTIIPFQSGRKALDEKQTTITEENIADFKVYEAVNKLLIPYGFEEYSEGQFKKVAGGSKYSADKIKNYYSGYGKVKYGYTKAEDVAEYCINTLENSLFVERDKVIRWLQWSMRAINGGYITIYSGNKKRYDIEAFLDITKGHMPEEAFKDEAGRKSPYDDILLDRDLYGGSLDTDEGSDVSKIVEDGEERDPNLKVQIKDVQRNFLVREEEFKGDRSADIYVGYKTHWPKENLGQRLLSHVDVDDKIFDDNPLSGIRVEKRGWAWPEDFEFLPSGEKKQNSFSFDNDNYYIHWTDPNLKPMSEFPYDQL